MISNDLNEAFFQSQKIYLHLIDALTLDSTPTKINLSLRSETRITPIQVEAYENVFKNEFEANLKTLENNKINQTLLPENDDLEITTNTNNQYNDWGSNTQDFEVLDNVAADKGNLLVENICNANDLNSVGTLKIGPVDLKDISDNKTSQAINEMEKNIYLKNQSSEIIDKNISKFSDFKPLSEGASSLLNSTQLENTENNTNENSKSIVLQPENICLNKPLLGFNKDIYLDKTLDEGIEAKDIDSEHNLKISSNIPNLNVEKLRLNDFVEVPSSLIPNTYIRNFIFNELLNILREFRIINDYTEKKCFY